MSNHLIEKAVYVDDMRVLSRGIDESSSLKNITEFLPKGISSRHLLHALEAALARGRCRARANSLV